MATTLQVVLQSNVDKVGGSGDLVKVRPGFARNFLIPRGLAVPATTAAVNRISHEKAVAIAKAEKTKKEATAMAEKLGAVKITIARSVGEDGRFFGSVTSKEIEAAAKAAGITLDRKKIQLAEPLKGLGLFDVSIRLMTDVTAVFKVEIVKK